MSLDSGNQFANTVCVWLRASARAESATPTWPPGARQEVFASAVEADAGQVPPQAARRGGVLGARALTSYNMARRVLALAWVSYCAHVIHDDDDACASCHSCGDDNDDDDDDVDDGDNDDDDNDDDDGDDDDDDGDV